MEKRENTTSGENNYEIPFSIKNELLHDRGGNSVENFNIRNIACKHRLFTKHSLVRILKGK